MGLLMKSGEVPRVNAIDYVVMSSKDVGQEGVFFFVVKEPISKIVGAHQGSDNTLVLSVKMRDGVEKTVSLMDMQPEQFKSIRDGKSTLAVLEESEGKMIQTYEEVISLN